MSIVILVYAIEFTVQTAFLFAALWIMVKLQKLNYNLPGLLGAAALSCALDMIPVVGHFIAVGVLLLCIWKITESEYVDVAFTVFVGYALTFGMNLFLLSALIGDLCPSEHIAEGEPEYSELLAEYQPDTNKFGPEISQPDPDESAAICPGTERQENKSSAAHLTQTNSPAVSTAEEVAKDIQLKGLIQNAGRPSLLVHTGIKTYTIVQGETLPVKTRKGQVMICFEGITAKQAVLKIDGRPFKLPL